MLEIRTVAVFWGRMPGMTRRFAPRPCRSARALARSGIRLVYGGGRVGLMGALAHSVLAAGGQVIGVIPDFLTRREVAHGGVTELVVTAACTAASAACSNWRTPSSPSRAGSGRWTRPSRSSPGGSSGCTTSRSCCATSPAGPRRCSAAIEAAVERGFAYPEVRRLYEVTAGVEPLLERLRSLATTESSAAALL